MKRILCFVLSVGLVFSLAFSVVAEEQLVYGDVNGDTSVNAKDALLVLRYTVKKEQFTEKQKKVAKVTKQDAPNAKDALCILQKCVGKLRHFEVEKTPLSWQQPEDYRILRPNNNESVILCNTYEELVTLLPGEEISYTEDYFEKGSLILFPIEDTDTACYHVAKDCYIVGDTLYMEWDRRSRGLGGQMARSYYYFVEVKGTLPELDNALFIQNRYKVDDENRDLLDKIKEVREYELDIFPKN